jgi:hypothetical protein
MVEDRIDADATACAELGPALGSVVCRPEPNRMDPRNRQPEIAPEPVRLGRSRRLLRPGYGLVR